MSMWDYCRDERSVTAAQNSMDILNVIHQLAESWNIEEDVIHPASISQTLARTLRSPPSANQNHLSLSPTPRPAMTPLSQNYSTPPVKRAQMMTVRSSKQDKNASSSGRRIQPVSVPLRPPDVQNVALFPSLSEASSSSNTPDKRSRGFTPKPNPFNLNHSSLTNGEHNKSLMSSTSERKLQKLENKFSSQRKNTQGEDSSFWPDLNTPKNKIQPVSITSQRKSNNEPDNSSPSKGPRKVPRSGELFAELSPEARAQVEKMAEQYSKILDNNLCQNVLEEFTFLFKLISSTRPGAATSIGNHLTSVAQQVYFVIRVLDLQLDSTMSSLDPQVIQTLIEKYPHRIPKHVRKHFEKWVKSQIEKNTLTRTDHEDSNVMHKPSEFHQCVTFRSETDGRANFPNQGDFHAFCKQRDIFYSIKKLWSEREEEFSHSESQGPGFNSRPLMPRNNGRNNKTTTPFREPSDPIYFKVKGLFSLNSSWANLSHFASLFTSQFILDSMEEGEKGSKEDQKIIEDDQMRSLLQSNPDRFAKLNNRMSTGSQSQSPQRDYIAFQKYFLNSASSPAFNQHLIDRISFEISQIEDSFKDAGSVNPKDTEVLLRKCVLLSKLLGYIYFLPYRNEGPGNQSKNVPATIEKEALVAKHLELRSNQRPPIDLKDTILVSLREQRLTFTLPWVIEFLSAADSISLQLPAFAQTLKVICTVYHLVLKITDRNSNVALKNLNFLRFWCGSLFSMERFPLSILYSEEDEDEIVKDLMKTGMKNGGGGKSLKLSPDDGDVPIDSCESIGERLTGFYFSSSFSLMTFILHVGLQQRDETLETVSSNGHIPEVKHIRPVPAKSPLKANLISKETQIQLQLESSFFDLNSPSVQKCVDFLADRVASNYVKKLRTNMPEERTKLAVQRIFGDTAASMCRQKMLQGLDEFLCDKLRDGVEILVGEDSNSISKQALLICQQIGKRKCTEKVVTWVQTHIKGEMFPIIEDLPPFVPPATEEASSANAVAPNASSSEWETTFEDMILLHRTIKQLHQGKSVSAQQVDKLLNSKALRDCSTLKNYIVDFGLAVIAFFPECLDFKRRMLLVSMCKKHWTKECRLLCPRNIMMIQDSRKQNQGEIWKNLSEFVKCLIKSEVITLEDVEEDCVKLLREDWPSETSTHLFHFLKKFTSSSSSTSSRSTAEDEKSREVIDWVAWFCSNPQEE